MLRQMNELIEELARDCWSTSKYDTTLDPWFNHRKFAELIVGECMDIAREYDAPKLSGPGVIIASRIESHFGVEE